MENETAGIQVASWAWSKKDEIYGKLKEIYAWFTRDKNKEILEKSGILILGAGGVGKSTLGKVLSGNYDFLFDAIGQYDESIHEERHSLQGAPQIEIMVPPGQKNRRPAAWNELHTDFVKGHYRGVILISAFGYHTLGQFKIKGHPLYQGNKVAFLKAYLEDRRNEEIQVLEQLIHLLSLCRGKFWALSLITKQDLWWANRSDVEKHYREGRYSVKVKELTDQLGQTSFRHEYAFASLIISNFITAKGEKLKPNTEGYDQAIQAGSLRRLFEVVGALKRWEEGK